MKKQKPKPALSAVTIRRLRRVAAHICAEPLSYDQGFAGTPRPGRKSNRHCGTPGCILGWIVALYPLTSEQRAAADEMIDDGIHFRFENFRLAAFILKLDLDAALRLWDHDKWPEKYKEVGRTYGFISNFTRLEARNAARRIEHFIKTDGKE